MKKLAMLLALAVVVAAFVLSMTMGVSAAGDKVRGDDDVANGDPVQNWEAPDPEEDEGPWDVPPMYENEQ